MGKGTLNFATTTHILFVNISMDNTLHLKILTTSPQVLQLSRVQTSSLSHKWIYWFKPGSDRLIMSLKTLWITASHFPLAFYLLGHFSWVSHTLHFLSCTLQMVLLIFSSILWISSKLVARSRSCIRSMFDIFGRTTLQLVLYFHQVRFFQLKTVVFL